VEVLLEVNLTAHATCVKGMKVGLRQVRLGMPSF